MSADEDLIAYAARLAGFDENGGDALVGMRKRYAQAVNLTQREKNRARIDAAEWGIRPDQLLVDSTELFNKAMADVGRGTISVTPGEYAITTLKLCSFVHLECNGATFVKTDSAKRSCAVSATGDEGDASPLVRNASRAVSCIEVENGSLFREQTWVLVRDNVHINKENGRNQELVYIKSVSGNTIELNVRLHRGYAVEAKAELVNVKPLIGASMSGAEIVLQRTEKFDGGGFAIDLAIGCDFSENTVRYPDSMPAFRVSRSTLITLKGNEVYDGQNAQTGGWFGQGVDVNQGSSLVTVENNRFININQNAFQNNAGYSRFAFNVVQGAADTAVNTHGSGSSHIDIVGNYIEGCNQGIAVSFSENTAADDNVTIASNRILNSGVNGISVANAKERSSHRIWIHNNRVEGFGFTSGGAGIYIHHVEGAFVDSNVVSNNLPGAATNALIWFNTVNDGVVRNNILRDAIKGVGIRWYESTGVHISGNDIAGVLRPFEAVGNSRCRLESNMIDARPPGEIDSGTLVLHNSWQAEPIAGSVEVAFLESSFASMAVLFPKDAFTGTPVVIVSAESTEHPFIAQYSNVSKTGFTVSVHVANGGAVTQVVNVNWNALAHLSA
ncbi:right-handed parallel beta-helix repeat-containing protein [Pseudomonas sp. TE50-2]|uniref:right-handed parallel beta-helix repeat-containing protein n=1 Tax=Pseudomonas sp. TE50-2 TaxID=3142707 RepID=UPI003465C069